MDDIEKDLRSKYYEEFAKYKYIIMITSVIKGRQCSTDKETQELLEVNPEKDNTIDKRAFRVHNVIPTCYTYGRVPLVLSVVFAKIDTFSDANRVSYEIWW